MLFDEVIKIVVLFKSEEEFMELLWILDDINVMFYVYFYFVEFEMFKVNESRKMKILWNGFFFLEDFFIFFFEYLMILFVLRIFISDYLIFF